MAELQSFKQHTIPIDLDKTINNEYRYNNAMYLLINSVKNDIMTRIGFSEALMNARFQERLLYFAMFLIPFFIIQA